MAKNILNDEQVDYLKGLIGEVPYAEFERKSGISEGNLGRILRQQSPIGTDTAVKIHFMVGEPLEDILHRLDIIGDELLPSRGRTVTLKGGEVYKIMGRIAADDSMGTRAHFYDDDVELGTLTLPRQVATFMVQGRSAEPVAWHGQYVMVDLNRSIHDTDLVVVRTREGNGYFKRVFMVDGIYELSPISDREHHPAIRLHPDDIEFIAPAIGVVFENAGLPEDSF